MRRFVIPLVVTLFLSLPAVNAFAAASLTVNVAGTRSGEVSSSSHLIETLELKPGEAWPPIACSGPPKTGQCTSTMDENFTVLYAFPDPGSSFAGWTIQAGEALFWCETKKEESGLYACAISAGEHAELTATFDDEPGEPLIVNIEGGFGTVVSNPAGIECSGEVTDACAKSYEGGEVTLTASPASHSLFKGWRGCDSGGVDGRQCTVTMSEAKEVGARFVKARNLTISKAEGSGLGLAKTKPGGIVCPYACTTATAAYDAPYKGARAVEVVTKPARHFHFVEFLNGTGEVESCDGHSEEEGCSYEPSVKDSSIEVLFEEDPKNTLTLEKEGGGQGFVKTKPSGILCGYACGSGEAQFYFDDAVIVKVKLNKGTTKLTWTTGAGTCIGSTELIESECTVPMSAVHELVTKFE